MDPEIAKLLNNTLPGALSVFAGSLPLLCVISWFTYQQGDRFKRIEDRLDRVDSRIDRLKNKIDKLTDAVTSLVTELRVMNMRVASLEQKEDQPRVLKS
jgi:uncharacterized protein YdcH (DUF465 family)